MGKGGTCNLTTLRWRRTARPILVRVRVRVGVSLRVSVRDGVSDLLGLGLR